MRVEQEGGAAAWLAGTLAAPSVQGRGLPLLQELWPYQSLLPRPSEGLCGQSFSIAAPIQALRRPPTGVLLCGSAGQVLNVAPWVGPPP